jgi:amphi-Trp domain-containing protein
MGDELFEHETKVELSREEAAQRLHALADAIARHNEVSFVQNNKTVRVDVPDTVQLKVEIERGEESEIEIEISW